MGVATGAQARTLQRSRQRLGRYHGDLRCERASKASTGAEGARPACPRCGCDGVCTARVRSVCYSPRVTACEGGVDCVRGCGPCAHSRARFIKAWDALGRLPCARSHFAAWGRCRCVLPAFGLSADLLSVPSCPGEAARLCYFLRSLGPLSKFLESGGF